MELATRKHQEAMSHVDAALVARKRSDADGAAASFLEAYRCEREAAGLVAGDLALEPTRSVLHRSAADLAIECGELREAERLAAAGLAGNPPDEIARELRASIEQAQFLLNMKESRLLLDPRELKIGFKGRLIGPGKAPGRLLLDRVTYTGNLIYRTAERLLDRPYRDSGRRRKELLYEVEPFVVGFATGSVVITFQMGHSDQLELELGEPDLSDRAAREVRDCLELFGAGAEDELANRINDEAYLRNFEGLAKLLEPDGDALDMVSFTYGQTEPVVLRPRPRGASYKRAAMPKEPRVVIKGRLREADAIVAGKNSIQLIDDLDQQHKLAVPEGMMADVVRPHWDRYVEVTATRKGRALILDEIREVEEPAE
jgi:hypothetical protein